MPVRSVKLKLVIPRSPDHAAIRAALWTTHAEVNAAADYYGRQLLVMRALPYELPGVAEGKRQIGQVDAEAHLLAAAREVQRRNRRRQGLDEAPSGTDTEVITAVRALYGHIVPDETGAASAQAANAYLSPLTDPASRGFAAAVDKLGRLRPNWLGLSDEDPALLEAANAWFASEASAEWRGDTGSPAAWLRVARKGEVSWPRLFRAKLDELAQAASAGPEGAVARLRALDLLPFFEAYFPPRMATDGSAVTPWDRLAFRLAVAHLLSWQAWVRRAAEQHAARRQTLQEYRARAVTSAVEDLLTQVRAYEATRSAELSRLGLGESVYALRPRQLRGWVDLRDAWRKLTNPSAEQLRQIATDQQTRKRGKFGDPQVFLWLAAPEQHALWSKEDVPTIAANLNAMQALVDRSRETATLTLPDARLHPRAVQWAAEGDTNLRPYRLRQMDDEMVAELSLLQRRVADGKLEETRSAFRLAPSTQFRVTEFGTQDGKARVIFGNGAGETFAATVGSADLLFDRTYLTRRQDAAIGAGDIGPVWLKLALDLDEQRPAGWMQNHARFTRHFSAALGKPTKIESDIQAGARVLAVDLGVRTFAACAVFELRDVPPASPGALAFPVPVGERKLWAVHERSFHLDMPDEHPGKDGFAWRRQQRAELQRIRRAFGVYRRAARLAGVPMKDRAAALEALQVAITESDPFAFIPALHSALATQGNVPQPVWDDIVAAC